MLINLIMFAVLSVAPTVSPDDIPAASPVYAGMVVGDADGHSDNADNTTQSTTKTPLVSINMDVLDMSWTSAMDLADPEILRPTGIVLPFLESHPIDRIEVKLHLLNLRF